jgi:Tol biopolymer transport system component
MKYLIFIKISLVFFICLFIITSISFVSAAEVSLKANGKIAFASNSDGNFEIYVMNSDGSGQTRLTSNNARDKHPRWSPDGTKIAFSSDRDGNYEIYVMNADGSGQTRLTNNNTEDARPSWSPDGSKIAFNSMRDGNNEVYIMNADGSGQTRLTNNNSGNHRPSWSPDGSKIIFESNRDGNAEIYVMKPDGSGQTRIINNNAKDEHPFWSPDGTKITFNSDRDGNAEIYVMNADGSGQTRLTSNNASDEDPDWQSLYVTSFQQTGVGSDFTGNILTVDSVSYAINQLPTSLPWNPGTSHTFSWTSPLTVSADKRYVWSSSSGLSTEKSGTLVATSKGDLITASYIAQYYVRFKAASGGSVAQSSNWYNASTTIAISATPSAGYKFSSWTVTGDVSVTDTASQNTTVIVNGTGDITANFAVAIYTVNASAGSGGSISPSGSIAVNHGGSQSFTITPNAGYNIADVLIDGSSGGAVSSYSFTNVVANHTITVTFAPSSTAPSTSTSTTSTPPSATSNAKKTNWGLIIGIIIVVVVIVLIIFFVLLRRRKSKEQS